MDFLKRHKKSYEACLINAHRITNFLWLEIGPFKQEATFKKKMCRYNNYNHFFPFVVVQSADSNIFNFNSKSTAFEIEKNNQGSLIKISFKSEKQP